MKSKKWDKEEKWLDKGFDVIKSLLTKTSDKVTRLETSCDEGGRNIIEDIKKMLLLLSIQIDAMHNFSTLSKDIKDNE